MVIWANRYLEYRYRKGYEEGYEEGLEIGRREAREKLKRERERRNWFAWHARYKQAINAGKHFDEPAPPKPEDVDWP